MQIEEVIEALHWRARWRLANSLAMDGITQQMLDEAVVKWRAAGVSNPNFLDIVQSLRIFASYTLMLMLRAAQMPDTDRWEDVQDYVESVDSQVIERLHAHLETLHPESKPSARKTLKQLVKDHEARTEAGGSDIVSANGGSAAKKQAAITHEELIEDIEAALDFSIYDPDELTLAISRNPGWVRKAVRDVLEKNIVEDLDDEDFEQVIYGVFKGGLDAYTGESAVNTLGLIYGVTAAERFSKAIACEEARRINAYFLRTSIRPYSDKDVIQSLPARRLRRPVLLSFDRKLTVSESQIITAIALGKPEIPQLPQPRLWVRWLTALFPQVLGARARSG